MIEIYSKAVGKSVGRRYRSLQVGTSTIIDDRIDNSSSLRTDTSTAYYVPHTVVSTPSLEGTSHHILCGPHRLHKWALRHRAQAPPRMEAIVDFGHWNDQFLNLCSGWLYPTHGRNYGGATRRQGVGSYSN